MFLIILLSAALAVTSGQRTLSVNTTEGVVVGYGDDYFEFYGLRYGGPVSGANRFKAPSPATPYPSEFHAMDRNIRCIQPTSSGHVGVEDCLYLDVFTKNVTYAKPVLVWLESEGYQLSRMPSSFRQLVTNDAVVVSLNYRLSIFGFLCLGVAEAPGNAGLKDIVLGLNWIKNNIAGFGGDPTNVVLLGHGSGAAIVDLLTMSPLAEGLFHKAIVLSGSVLAPWAVAYDPIGYAEIVGAKLAYEGKNSAELARSLVNTNIEVLMPVLEQEFTNNSVLFAPCIENTQLNGSFLTDAPINILRSGNYSQVPYLIGYTDREGTIRAAEADTWKRPMFQNFTQFLGVDLAFDTDANKKNASASIFNFYFGNSTEMDIEDYLDYHGDTSILVPAIRGALERASTSSAKVHLFEFAYRGSTNADWTYPAIPLNGVKHGGILEYLFGTNLTEQGAQAMFSFIRRLLVFANAGTPNFATPRDDAAQWLTVSNSSFNYFYFGGSPGHPMVEESKINPHTQRMTFWNQLYSKYYKTPVPVSSASKIVGLSLLLILCQILVF
uniref:Carboxylesterase n=1 Tax=Plodia interpunctella TaxID=58824 RepID=A0A5B8R4Y8_PLOIN|nr:carboxylesterase [Plodia interpunctella]